VCMCVWGGGREGCTFKEGIVVVLGYASKYYNR
jgi:hypothetical protein